MQVVPALIEAGIKVIDLSADYRLKTDVFEKTYKLKHTDPREAVYGIPELHPEVSSQQFIANPGCYPTGASLAAAPLANAGLIERVVFDSKSGISGAGVEPSSSFPLSEHGREYPGIQAHNTSPPRRNSAGTHTA